MCGISGFANWQQPVSLDEYYHAHRRLQHRGSDDEGFFVVQGERPMACRGDASSAAFARLAHIQEIAAANLVLGHRRLAILDLSPAGHQPMSSRSGRFTMTYNGEIYNYLELRRELRAAGHHFESDSDSEVILAALEQWGTSCFPRFNGMWAMAVYDAAEQRLILTRDRFGIKPLYYAVIDETLFFGSETKFLLPFLRDLRVNEARAMDYLVHNVIDHHPETMFQDVLQLQPGCYATWDSGGLRTHSYWQVPPASAAAPLTLDDAVSQLSELLTSAVDLRLRSDVPVGSLLSGGLDSTTIVCLVRQLLDDQGAGNSFEFFSAVFHEEIFSERRYIEDTVRQTGMPVHWVYPDPTRLEATLPDLLYHQDFPFRSLAVFSQWEIMQRVRETPIVVLLNGQGSDELFGGYTLHYYALIAEYLRRGRPVRAWQQLHSLTTARQLTLIQGIAYSLYQLAKASPLKALLDRRDISYLNRKYRTPTGWAPQDDIFRDVLVRNLTFSALPEYLRYEDRNSMACTLESRLPFLDYRLVEWAMALPAELKIERQESKHVLRAMARPLIPRSVSQRTDKMGFVSPQEQWQRRELSGALDRVFDQDLQALFPFLDGDRAKARYRGYQEGKNDDWAWVWRMACLFWWHEQWWRR